jgi:anti-sigma factor RsiW
MTTRDGTGEGLTCQDVIGLLAEYLDSVLNEERLAELEEHLADCEPCRAYLKTYRRTIGLTAQAERVAMPDEMRERLRTFLLRQLSSWTLP